MWRGLVCSAGQYRDLADAEDIAVPADDLRALEQALLAVRGCQTAVHGVVPSAFAIPVLLGDTGGDPALTVPAEVRKDAQGVWIVFHTATGQECAAVLVAHHNGQIELKVWTQPAVQDEAAITAILIDDVASLTTTEGTHHVE